MDLKGFLSGISPLDLIIFSGKGPLSKTIEWFEGSPISHVGIAITKEICPNLKIDDEDMYIWESTTSDKAVPSAETGLPVWGVQIRRLGPALEEYLATPGTNVGYCPLIDNPGLNPSNYAKIRATLGQIYDKYEGDKYNFGPVALLATLFPSLRKLRNLNDKIWDEFLHLNPWLFCSEFVADIYEALGIIGPENMPEPNPEDIAPIDLLGAKFVENGHPMSLSIVKMPPIMAR